ncbi:MAG: ribbon-helix-helix domain-containing protein [Bacteroidetes bacterium]|nr:ribbon-helix-helix domain-containing protein [Bacteroidota bacterium]
MRVRKLKNLSRKTQVQLSRLLESWIKKMSFESE